MKPTQSTRFSLTISKLPAKLKESGPSLERCVALKKTVGHAKDNWLTCSNPLFYYNLFRAGCGIFTTTMSMILSCPYSPYGSLQNSFQIPKESFQKFNLLIFSQFVEMQNIQHAKTVFGYINFLQLCKLRQQPISSLK